MESMRDINRVMEREICFVPLICISALFQIFLRYIEITSDRFQIYRLENVGDVLFQALMLDDVKIKDGMMYADFLSVILDNIVDNY